MTADAPTGAEIYWHEGTVTPQERFQVVEQQGKVLWFTGLSGSGKSTLARALEKELVRQGQLAFVLDGDNVRHGLNADLGFSEEDRKENLRRLSEVAKLFCDAGVLVITAFISPLREAREHAAKIIGAERFLEIYLSTPLEVCEDRDPKGLYQKARAEEIQAFTGVSAPFEPPSNPACTLNTEQVTTDECLQTLMELLRTENTFQPPA